MLGHDLGDNYHSRPASLNRSELPPQDARPGRCRLSEGVADRRERALSAGHGDAGGTLGSSLALRTAEALAERFGMIEGGPVELSIAAGEGDL